MSSGPGDRVRVAKANFIEKLFAFADQHEISSGITAEGYFKDVPASQTCSDWVENGHTASSAETCKTCNSKYISKCPDHNTTGKLFAKNITASLPRNHNLDFMAMGIDETGPGKVNMDVFSAQQAAEKRARVIYNVLTSSVFAVHLADFQAIVEAEVGDEDVPDHEIHEDLRIRYVVVGASVSGLTFHATLAHLMQTDDACPDFEDLFTVSFVDIYMRPMERLRQARDRTIVPRFEYERLLNTTLPIDPATFTPPESGSEYLTLDPVTHSGSATPEWDQSHPDMPANLRWQAGPAREVAASIEQGYAECLDTFYTSADRMGSHNSFSELHEHLGCLFQGVQEIAPLEADSKHTNNTHLFQIKLETFQNSGIVPARPERRGDILLFATGLGIDVPGEHPQKVEPRQSHYCDCIVTNPGTPGEARMKRRPDQVVHEFPSEQRSYWDPAKPELDLSEARASEIFVVGNSDSAAGAIFATLLREFDHCTFKTLACMILEPASATNYSATQLWFQRVSTAVQSWSNTKPGRGSLLTTTEKWHYALRDPDVQAALFTPDPGLASELPAKYLRTTRTVLVAIKNRDEFKATIKSVQEGTAPPSPLEPGDLVAAEALMSRAWPENRLLAACLFPWLDVRLVDIGGDAPGALEIKRDNTRIRGTYLVSGSAIPLRRLSNNLDPAPFPDREFKYVLNCGGPDYFQHRGNAMVPKRQDSEETTWFTRVKRRFCSSAA